MTPPTFSRKHIATVALVIAIVGVFSTYVYFAATQKAAPAPKTVASEPVVEQPVDAIERLPMSTEFNDLGFWYLQRDGAKSTFISYSPTHPDGYALASFEHAVPEEVDGVELSSTPTISEDGRYVAQIDPAGIFVYDVVAKSSRIMPFPEDDFAKLHMANDWPGREFMGVGTWQEGGIEVYASAGGDAGMHALVGYPSGRVLREIHHAALGEGDEESARQQAIWSWKAYGEPQIVDYDKRIAYAVIEGNLHAVSLKDEVVTMLAELPQTGYEWVDMSSFGDNHWILRATKNGASRYISVRLSDGHVSALTGAISSGERVRYGGPRPAVPKVTDEVGELPAANDVGAYGAWYLRPNGEKADLVFSAVERTEEEVVATFDWAAEERVDGVEYRKDPQMSEDGRWLAWAEPEGIFLYDVRAKKSSVVPYPKDAHEKLTGIPWETATVMGLGQWEGSTVRLWLSGGGDSGDVAYVSMPSGELLRHHLTGGPGESLIETDLGPQGFGDAEYYAETKRGVLFFGSGWGEPQGSYVGIMRDGRADVLARGDFTLMIHSPDGDRVYIASRSEVQSINVDSGAVQHVAWLPSSTSVWESMRELGEDHLVLRDRIMRHVVVRLSDGAVSLLTGMIEPEAYAYLGVHPRQ